MEKVGLYFSDHQWPGERRRLTLLEERYDPGTVRRMVNIGITRGWSCLEVGAEADVDICQGGSPMAEFRQLGLAQLREALLQTGVITEAEFVDGTAYLSDPSHWVMDFASVAAWGQKPCRLTQELNE